MEKGGGKMKSFFGKSNNIMFLQTFSVDQTRMWKAISHSQMRESRVQTWNQS